MFNFYFTIALIYLAIAFGVALVFHFVLRKPVLGSFWGALLVAVVGAFLGGVIELFLGDFVSKIISTLANLNNSVNVFPPLIIALLLVAIFARISKRN